MQITATKEKIEKVLFTARMMGWDTLTTSSGDITIYAPNKDGHFRILATIQGDMVTTNENYDSTYAEPLKKILEGEG